MYMLTDKTAPWAIRRLGGFFASDKHAGKHAGHPYELIGILSNMLEIHTDAKSRVRGWSKSV